MPPVAPVRLHKCSILAARIGDDNSVPASRRLMTARELKRSQYELQFEDGFESGELDAGRWLPYYLPHWSSRERSAARYAIEDGCLQLLIEADQQPWCPELDGDVRVSSLQTGLFCGPVGTTVGQHRFHPDARVREAQENVRLYTPCHGLIEVRARAIADPHAMVALWLIGYEDDANRSGELCVCEVFGRDVTPTEVGVGMGIHAFGDPNLVEDFARVSVPIDAREFHVYSAEWTPERVSFFVDDEHVKTVDQSPSYPLQLMLGIYEFPVDGKRAGAYPKRFTVDYVRGFLARA